MAHRSLIASALTALFFAAISGCKEAPASEETPAPPPAAPATTTSASGGETQAPLAFAIEGQTLRTLSRAELEAAVPSETLTHFDPYHGRNKTFRALPLGEVLSRGFAGRARDLREEHFVLRAQDGYTVPIAGERLLEPGGFLAVEDLDVPGWEPIGPQKANPGPYYLIWTKSEQSDLEHYPRPWQLVRIELTRFELVFSRTVPTGEAPDSPAQRGFSIFREQCIRCHAINQQGGQVGPELNIPRNILAYRPEEQVRAYIENPLSFRYSKMPAFPSLTPRDLDDLVAYLRAMGTRQQEPEGGAGP